MFKTRAGLLGMLGFGLRGIFRCHAGWVRGEAWTAQALLEEIARRVWEEADCLVGLDKNQKRV